MMLCHVVGHVLVFRASTSKTPRRYFTSRNFNNFCKFVLLWIVLLIVFADLHSRSCKVNPDANTIFVSFTIPALVSRKTRTRKHSTINTIID